LNVNVIEVVGLLLSNTIVSMILMARPRGKTDVTCPNQECKYFQVEEGKYIIKKGKNRAGNQKYYCYHCNRYFVETINSVFYQKHLSQEEIINICEELLSCTWLSEVAPRTGFKWDTISKLISDIADNCDAFDHHLHSETSWDEVKIKIFWRKIYDNKLNLNLISRFNIKSLIDDC